MKRSEMLLMIATVPVDFLMLMFAAVCSYQLRFTDWALSLRAVTFELSFSSFIHLSIWVALLWLVIFASLKLYTPDANRKLANDFVRVITGCFIGLGIVAIYVMFTQQLFDSRFLVITSFIFSVVFVLLGRLVMRGVKSVLYRMGVGLRRVVLIGEDASIKDISIELNTRRELGYRVIGTFSSFSKAVEKKLLDVSTDEVIFVRPRFDDEALISAISFCHEHHITFKYAADLFSSYASHVTVHPLAGVPIVELRRTPLEGWGRVAKRLFDIIVSICVLVLFSPLYVLLIFLVFIDSGRPIIYKNARVGVRGALFTAYKFRSMYQKDCTGPQFGVSGKKALKKEEELIEKQNTRVGPIYKVGNDPRVTSFGRVLRRISLDEFPQFVNVLKGDMSIVGPRPHQPREVSGYIEEHKKVFTVKPGITGLSQISGRSDLLYDDEVRLDVFYIEHWSLLLDLIILVKTPFILFRRRRAL
ncbi:MAG: sugar transferase [Candidatus Magasanikbacteria bacterium]|jgi:exopolysaccharide biosynthesis polyprenyl glycosylphosphotransferase|nr:sugar transferase [Candidatus Magasanikbacteria bacterium]MBT4220724.1 sugar transferase [Candidatus Magasanikbacteria bacterium]MBT4350069.1 sugar transferase [Candidatus Magasanikbacteria bacterium]MBT6253016.1 sugar transferase [Candidatus Magasanikbacteria bacterium]MBT7755359.1 sugar transferase [Candidatus Magasanikbacteria bacterium]